MKITICGSMSFTKEMAEIKNVLEKQGHRVVLPLNTEKYIDNPGGVEKKWEKIEHDVIRFYFKEIESSDAILVLNYDKNGVKNYIGGNSLIEMAFAHVLNKQTYLLNPIPKMNYADEIEAMQPIVIDGNLNLIMEEKFRKIKEEVKKELSCSAHNMDHIMRVYNMCLRLAENENVDWEVLKAAVLLHDIARVKEDNDSSGNTDHAILSSQMCAPILQNLNFSEEKIKHIQDCIVSHRYRNGNEPVTLEAKILFDADKLDAVGALGVARGYVWVGRNGANIYRKTDMQEYANENLGGKINGRIQDKTKHSPQIEFETKLKSLADKLYTEKAKEICRERTEYYRNFLDRLEKEIKGEI